MEKFLFKEEQRFTQWWMWVLIISSFLIPMVLLGNELTNSEETLELIFSLGIVCAMGFLVTWLIGKMKLFVEITYEEIKFRFPPFLFKWRSIKKNEIERFEVRTYKPIREFGGWGVKGMNPLNRAYNVKGNVGLQLHLIGGKKILFGTQKKQAIQHAMNRLINKETGI